VWVNGDDLARSGGANEDLHKSIDERLSGICP